MAKPNPPPERKAKQSRDILHDWVKAQLRDLHKAADAYRRDRTLQILLTMFCDVAEDFDDAGRAACCSHGRVTLEVPCRGDYAGCPHRSQEHELDDGYGRERRRGYDR